MSERTPTAEEMGAECGYEQGFAGMRNFCTGVDVERKRGEAATSSLRTDLDTERLTVASMALALIEAEGKARAAEERADRCGLLASQDRDARERAEKIAAAERALRLALESSIDQLRVDDRDGGPVDVASRALRALGVEP